MDDVRTRHLILLLACGVLAACSEPTEEVPAAYRPSSAWDEYRHGLQGAGLAGTALGLDWRRAADAALSRPVEIDLPYVERGSFDAREAHAFGYRFGVVRGQRVRVSLILDGPSPLVFLDLFRDQGEPRTHVASADAESRVLEFEPRQNADYVLRLQPELLRGGDYDLRIEAEPALGFPVAGHDVGAIQSAFGAPRDAGRRSHHGVDIFAPRGTPAVAVSHARVRRVREQNLGGLTVWLYDAKRRLHLYYAHLDEQLVQPGDLVGPGDIVGRVGNTGNARTTPPHLHFAIYAAGEGPVNPDAFLREPRGRWRSPRVDLARLGEFAVTGSATSLRRAVARGADPAADLLPGTPLRIWAGADSYYRVTLSDGTPGYVPAGTVAAPVPVNDP